MTNQDRGPLVAVIAPDVDGLPPYITPNKRYEVIKIAGGIFTIVCDDGDKVEFVLTGNVELNGADWIAIHANDVIQGFGEHRTRGGEYVYIGAYNAGGEGIPLWSEVGKAGENLTPRSWTSAGEMRPPGPPAYPRETPDDITGPWEEAEEQDDCGSGDKFTYAMDGHLNGMCEAPQEIPAVEAIQRLLDGEVLELINEHGVWVPMRFSGATRVQFNTNGYWHDQLEDSLAGLVSGRWRIPTPETFGKEEAAQRLMNDEVLHPIGWDHRENVRFRKRIMQVVNTRTGTPWAWAAFPDDQLFIGVE